MTRQTQTPDYIYPIPTLKMRFYDFLFFFTFSSAVAVQYQLSEREADGIRNLARRQAIADAYSEAYTYYKRAIPPIVSLKSVCNYLKQNGMLMSYLP